MAEKQALPAKILVVDDDAMIIKQFENQLMKHNVSVVAAKDLDSAFYLFNQQRFEVAIVELEFEFMPGLALIQKWRQHEVEEKRLTGFVLSCGQQMNAGHEKLLQELGNLEILVKPFKIFQVLTAISKAMNQRKSTIAFKDVREEATNLYRRTKDAEQTVGYIKGKMPVLGQKGIPLLTNFYENVELYEEGLGFVDAVLNQRPQDVPLLNSKGKFLLKLDRSDEAVKAFETADELAPQNIERLEGMIDSYLEASMPKESIAKMKELTALHPEEPDMKFNMFAKLFDYGYEDDAVAYCRETTGPNDVVRYYNNRGVALARSGEYDKALHEYERALKFFPDFKGNYRIYFNIALSMAGKKDPDSLKAALTYTKKCLSLSPKFEKAVALKGRLEQKVAS